jgi:DNA-binding NarL/FixJ family response regulator
LCVEDHQLVREGITLIIDRETDMKVVAAAATGEEAVALHLGSMTGVEATLAIRREDAAARIVVLTMSQADEDIHRALKAGAATYLLKDTMSSDLIRVIRDVSAGGEPAIRSDLRARLAERAAGPTLTAREVQVVELISRGMRNKEIGAALGISEETAQVHVKNVLAKLRVQDRTAAVRVALQRGIIHLS